MDLRHITRLYFSDFEDPDIINAGWCFCWAWMAALHHPELQLCTFVHRGWGDAHAFIKFGDLYYDSSYPRGTKTLKKLWFFRERDITSPLDGVLFHPPHEFKQYWARNGRPNAWGDQGLRPWPLEIGKVS